MMFENISNELEALNVIYEELHYQIDESNSSIQGCISIEVKLEQFKEFIVKDKDVAFTIKHLPMITLNFWLHNNSEEVFFNIDGIWLTETFKNKLRHKMQAITSEEGILWYWLQFIELESLNYLFNIYKDDVVEVDVKCLNDGEKIDLLSILIKYDIDKERSVFNNSIFNCEACMVSKKGINCIRLRHCSDIFCVECATDYFNTQIKSGCLNLQCLVCGGEIDYDEIKDVLNKDAFNRWDQLVFNNYLRKTESAKSCPRCTTMSVVEDRLGLCPKCHYSFCSKCDETYHADLQCHKEEIEKKRREEKRIRELEEKEAENFRKLETEEKTKNAAHPCPGCNMMYQKISGCNKMTCSMCGVHFCYICGKLLNKVNPYNHFGDASQCDLFNSILSM